MNPVSKAANSTIDFLNSFLNDEFAVRYVHKPKGEGYVVKTFGQGWEYGQDLSEAKEDVLEFHVSKLVVGGAFYDKHPEFRPPHTRNGYAGHEIVAKYGACLYFKQKKMIVPKMYEPDEQYVTTYAAKQLAQVPEAFPEMFLLANEALEKWIADFFELPDSNLS